jgi:2-oxoglutarate dehydrogenase E2 component (dihydrolipoamide succinyltransferase)
MSKFELLMPKMGESVQEATITKWFKKEGEMVEEEEPILEIATDKVDSEIPSPVDGKITRILFKENDVVAVGEVIAHINMDGDETAEEAEETAHEVKDSAPAVTSEVEKETTGVQPDKDFSASERFYSPLVKNIAKAENIGLDELEEIEGTGINGRVKKEDILNYIKNREAKAEQPVSEQQQPSRPAQPKPASVSVNPGDQVLEMDRMRRMIADHMVMSKQVSPHVTNFIEADVTEIVRWRDKMKGEFMNKEGVKLTYLPIFTEAIVKALKDYPGVNAAVDGNNIILRKNINVGIAVALPNGNLIVPVVKNADQKNLLGLAVEINDMAQRARENKLGPDEIQGGTFSISNFGTFRNITGTPIINQPQVAIMAVGTIEKKPAVLETPAGDVIAIRHKMILSLSYDHRVVDGALGGAYLRKVADYLEQFDVNRKS